MKLFTHTTIAATLLIASLSAPSGAYDRSDLLFDALSPNHACNNGTAPEGHMRKGAFCDTINNPKTIYMGRKAPKVKIVTPPASVTDPVVDDTPIVVVPDGPTAEEIAKQRIEDAIREAKERAEQWAADHAAEIAEAKRKAKEARDRFCSRVSWC